MTTTVLVFAKVPRPGQVKTRLQPALSAFQAAALHARMVEHALVQARASRLGPVTLYVAGEGAEGGLSDVARRHGCELRAQVGSDLGERMRRAMADGLMGFGRVLLMGTDCPDLTASRLVQASSSLVRADVVLAPAVDGGYVLIGARASCDAIFEGIAWSTAAVLGQTRERLQTAGLSWAELAPLRDVDRPQDLDLLPLHLWMATDAPKV